MDFAYTAEQEALRQLAEDVLSSADDAARLQEVERDPTWFDRPLWRRLGQSDLLAVTTPTGVGGLGLGFLEACLVVEQAGRTLAHVPLLPTLVGAGAVARFGTADHLTLLRPLVDGEGILTTAVRLARDQAPTSRSEGGRWVLDGELGFVPYAHVADRVVTVAGPAGAEGLFVVDPRADGVTVERQRTMSGDPQFVLRFAGTPAEALVAPGPGGSVAARWLRERLQVAYCALELGIVETALAMTAAYTSGRQQFGRPIATFQGVAHRMADAYIDVLAMRWTTLEAAAALGDDQEAAEAVATAKWWACEGGHRVVSAAQHCHGGVGVDMSYPLYRYFLWSKEVEVALGGAAEQLAEVGRRLAGPPERTEPA